MPEREFPVDPQRYTGFNGLIPRPVNEYEALMSTAPYVEPEMVEEDYQACLDVVRDLLSALDEEELWIIEGHFWRRWSFRQIEEMSGISKSEAHRIKDRALAKLKAALGADAAAELADRLNIIGVDNGGTET